VEDADLLAARALLDCRVAATAPEVRTAYRRALQRTRPDLGTDDGTLTARLQSARDLLLAQAPPDRRRRPRASDGRAPAAYVPLRKAAWGLVEEPSSSVVARL